MRSSTFRRGRTRRALAVSAAAGVFALSGPALSATAQAEFEMPQLNPAYTPSGGALSSLGGSYEQKQACMQGNPGGGLIEEKPWAQLVLGFEDAHAQGWTGAGQRVAVIDTGINSHPLLPSVDDGGSNVPIGGATVDCDGHGTAVAGVIAAQPDPDFGFVGIAPSVSLISLRQSSSLFQQKESGATVGNTETMAQAVQHAIEMGATVINISQSSCQPVSRALNPADSGNQELHNAVKNAYEAGIVVVAAAGNVSEQCQKNPSGSPTTAVLPAAFDDYVLTVASVNNQGAPSEFTVPGPWVDVAAPGEQIVTLDPGKNGSGLASQIATGAQGEMGPIQGTSFAAPYVSGLAALIKQKHPDLTAKQVMERIEQTSMHPGGRGGRNDIVGFGMVDPMAALGDVVPAEHGKKAQGQGKPKLRADLIKQRDWPAVLVALGATGGGVAALIFTAFLTNAVRKVRERRQG